MKTTRLLALRGTANQGILRKNPGPASCLRTTATSVSGRISIRKTTPPRHPVFTGKSPNRRSAEGAAPMDWMEQSRSGITITSAPPPPLEGKSIKSSNNRHVDLTIEVDVRCGARGAVCVDSNRRRAADPNRMGQVNVKFRASSSPTRDKTAPFLQSLQVSSTASVPAIASQLRSAPRTISRA